MGRRVFLARFVCGTGMVLGVLRVLRVLAALGVLGFVGIVGVLGGGRWEDFFDVDGNDQNTRAAVSWCWSVGSLRNF